MSDDMAETAVAKAEHMNAWRGLTTRRVAPLGVSVIIVAAMGLTGAMVVDSADEVDPSDLAEHPGFTPPGSEADWPPRPVGAADDGDLETIDDSQPSVVESAAADPAELSPAVVAALGDDWVLISSEPAINGKDGSLPAVDTYFSYDLNQTVRIMAPHAEATVEAFGAAEFQPVISPDETVRATELGRAWLLRQGHADVRDREGFGIRALDDGEFYDVRMVYITYSTDAFADPEFAALVDLTNGVVVEGGEL